MCLDNIVCELHMGAWASTDSAASSAATSSSDTMMSTATAWAKSAWGTTRRYLFVIPGLTSLAGNPDAKAKPHNVVIIGLDGAGKSTLLRRLHGAATGNIKETGEAPLPELPPTIGFALESLKLLGGALSVELWDLGGQKSMRHLWKHYLHEVDAILFVVDAADLERFDEAQAEFLTILAAEVVKKSTPFTLLALNKSDIADSMDESGFLGKVDARLLHGAGSGVAGASLKVIRTSAKTGGGLADLLKWLAVVLQQRDVIK